MKIYVVNSQRDVSIRASSVRNIVKEVIKNESIMTDEVTIHLISKEHIVQLHQDFFEDPTPTDCITFPIDALSDQKEKYHVLGEVFIAPQAAIDFLKAFDKEELYAEITLYLVHGLLHLAEYDDIDEKERGIMEEAEKRHLSLLFDKNLFLKG